MLTCNQLMIILNVKIISQVFRFDHHCYWMGVCIGARNLRWFMAFVFVQGLTYVYGAMYMLLALWSAYSRAVVGDTVILRFLGIEAADQIRYAVLTALVYRCADILTLMLIATGASAWLIDMFVRKSREICNNRSKPALSLPSIFTLLFLLSTNQCHGSVCVSMQRGTNR